MGLLGQPIRVLPAGTERALHLTFDDGPDPAATPAILRVLRAHRAAATFFMVARTARRHPGLVEDVLREGHAVGNHSLDHAYRHYFRGPRHMRDWVAEAEAELSGQMGQPTVGFRPPAGIRTPELAWALRDLRVPLVLWRVRFFDAVWAWRARPAVASLRRTPAGAIVLLHDGQSAGRLPGFLQTLDAYLASAVAQGFVLRALAREALLAASALGQDPGPIPAEAPHDSARPPDGGRNGW